MLFPILPERQGRVPILRAMVHVIILQMRKADMGCYIIYDSLYRLSPAIEEDNVITKPFFPSPIESRLLLTGPSYMIQLGEKETVFKIIAAKKYIFIHGAAPYPQHTQLTRNSQCLLS